MLFRVFALSLTLVAALGGCAKPGPAGTGAPGVATSVSAPPSINTKDIVACQALQQANATYQPQLAAPGVKTNPNVLRAWINQVSSAAVVIDDPVLKAQLLSLANTIEGWITRAPSKVQIIGFTDDVGRACGKYLNPPSATP
jgi:hypothetical protein